LNEIENNMKSTRTISLVIGVLLVALLIWYVLFRDHRRTIPADSQSSRVARTEELVGIGAVVGPADHGIKIMKIVSNTPAFRAGLSDGLVIQKIDDTETDGKSVKACVDLLRGTAGTKVRLEFVDPTSGKTNTAELTREKIF
jgi:C-terminal processing protease CtpA/Prc